MKILKTPSTTAVTPRKLASDVGDKTEKHLVANMNQLDQVLLSNGRLEKLLLHSIKLVSKLHKRNRKK